MPGMRNVLAGNYVQIRTYLGTVAQGIGDTVEHMDSPVAILALHIAVLVGTFHGSIQGKIPKSLQATFADLALPDCNKGLKPRSAVELPRVVARIWRSRVAEAHSSMVFEEWVLLGIRDTAGSFDERSKSTSDAVVHSEVAFDHDDSAVCLPIPVLLHRSRLHSELHHFEDSDWLAADCRQARY